MKKVEKNCELKVQQCSILDEVYFQGWTKFYEFGLSDLRSGAEIIDRLFARSRKFVRLNGVMSLV